MIRLLKIFIKFVEFSFRVFWDDIIVVVRKIDIRVS